MKGFLTVLTSLLVLPAFAEVAPVYYEDIVEYTDKMIDAADEASVSKNNSQRAKTNRVSSRSSAPRSGAAVRASSDSMRNTQHTANRATVSRTASNVATAKPTTARSTASRSGVTTRARQSVQTSPAVRARVGTGLRTVTSANKSNTSGYVTQVGDNGESLYNGTSRIGVGTRRASTLRVASTTPTTSEVDVTTATTNLEALAELTEYCKTQYAACMDNYCNVLDDNQGRCSCSKNIKNYQKVEDALTQATSDFQDVIQKIKYIGLTADQVTSLFEETEAELAMSSSKDQSKLNSSLDQIKRKIVDATSPSSSSYVVDSNMSLDISGLLDFDLSSAFDLSAFLNTGSKTSTTSVTNQRGEQLYKSATARCKAAILDSCTSQGVEANVITNSYDLEIDKQCIIYERNLNDANAEMKDNVRNAGIILQQARLMLAQNKNAYDFRGCVAAIDSCMQDEYVCGSDYELCLDPTGKYISEAEIIKGGTPGRPGGTVVNYKTEIDEENFSTWTSGGMYDLYATWNYGEERNQKNAWGGGQSETLGEYIDTHLSSWKSNYTESNGQEPILARYLLQKIGYIDANDKAHGMCASVLKQCQDYTFKTTNSKKMYVPDNDVIRQYLQTTLNKIKVQQDEILADYAEDCQSDVLSCLSSNNYDADRPESYASQTALGSCRTEIQTCMSVSGQKQKDNTGYTLRAMQDWLKLFTLSCPANYYLAENEDSTVECKTCPKWFRVETSDGKTWTRTTDMVQTGSAAGSVSCTCPSEYAVRMYTIATETEGGIKYENYYGCEAPSSTSTSTTSSETPETPAGGNTSTGGNSTYNCAVNTYWNGSACEACPNNTISDGGDVERCHCREGEQLVGNSPATLSCGG